MADARSVPSSCFQSNSRRGASQARLAAGEQRLERQNSYAPWRRRRHSSSRCASLRTWCHQATASAEAGPPTAELPWGRDAQPASAEAGPCLLRLHGIRQEESTTHAKASAVDEGRPACAQAPWGRGAQPASVEAGPCLLRLHGIKVLEVARCAEPRPCRRIRSCRRRHGRCWRRSSAGAAAAIQGRAHATLPR